MADLPPTIPSVPPPPPKKHGCLFYGCITLIVLFLIAAIGTVLALRYAFSATGGLVNQYTSTNPMPIESIEVSAPEFKSLQDRLAAFGESLEGRPGSRELVLTAHDINSLIQNDREYAFWKDKLFIVIEGDQIKGKLSLPLEDIGPFKLKGRYLNGIATLGVSLQNGVLDIKVKDVRVGDKPLPGPLLAQIKSANFADQLQNDPQARNNIQKLESIKVQDGKIVLRARQPEKP